MEKHKSVVTMGTDVRRKYWKRNISRNDE